MVFAVRCPATKCRKYMLVEDTDRGRTVVCLICKTRIAVPGAPQASLQATVAATALPANLAPIAAPIAPPLPATPSPSSVPPGLKETSAEVLLPEMSLGPIAPPIASATTIPSPTSVPSEPEVEINFEEIDFQPEEEVFELQPDEHPPLDANVPVARKLPPQ